MKFTQIPSDTFSQLQLNAGIVVDGFTPATGVIGNIIGATSGGVNFKATPNFVDFGEDIDNTPNNTKDLKKINYYDVSMTGTLVTVTAAVARMLTGAASIDGSDATHIVPRHELQSSDFDDVWWIGDYSNQNNSVHGGFIAIHLMNALSTEGFQIQSNDDGKGTVPFTFTGHYSIDDPDSVPFEIYVQAGTAPSVTLSDETASIVGTGTKALTATTDPADATVSWKSSNTAVCTVSNGTVTGVAAGTANVTASITVDNVVYSDTCAVTVTAQA